MGAVVAVCAAVAAFLAVPGGQEVQPLEVAGTGWQTWTMWDGRAAAPWGVERVMRFESEGAAAWHASGRERPTGDSLDWRAVPGGWVAFYGAGESLWGQGPVEGEYRALWHPQRHGTTRLEVGREGVWSTFHAVGLAGESLPVQATQYLEAPVGAELPEAWAGWRELAQSVGQTDWASARASRHADPWGHPALVGRGDGTRLEVVRGNGERLEVWGWADSSGVAAEWAARGWAWRDSLPWARIGSDGLHVGTGVWTPPSSSRVLPPVDAWTWSVDAGYSEARLAGGGRLAWTSLPSGEQPERPLRAVDGERAREPEGEQALPAEGQAIGTVRNHRSKQRMEIRWDGQSVSAHEGSRVVWDIAVKGELIGRAAEVDLYRNGKYQCAFATTHGVHLIDVLGREVAGFPIAPSSGVSAWLVADYDRDRQFRFLVATPDGNVLNFRDEGTPTPGWSFVPSGAAVEQLAHLRVGSKDYLYAGCSDRSVRLLSRAGADRSETTVQVPPHPAPAFRVGGNIGSSTVLYIGDDGWVEERTFGANEPVGMSRRTQGAQVATEDTDGDGKPEVVVTDATGTRSVWNQRNEQIR